ncbi:MAG: hypothetical protein RL272_782 [Candidatus Parcubacteria bacterium]|jgi:hypothetical protein
MVSIMSVRMIVRPRVTVSREEFLTHPPYSVAIDGYCSGAPFYDAERRILNINHHEDCDRIATRSSCAQAFHLVNMGLFDAFMEQGKPHADLYVGDGDEDVIWTTYALMHRQHVEDPRFKFRLREMIQLEDVLDMSAGLYPIKKRWHLLKRLLWICQPYSDARADGSLHAMDGDAMQAMIMQCHRRIRDTLYGRGNEVEPDDRFEVIADFERWQFIREVGRHARIGVAQKGLKAFVSHVARCSGTDGDRYVIIRRSQFIDWFPIGRMCDMLNAAEGTDPKSNRCWGGNRDNVIGSPREHGSRLRPAQVLEIVKAACDSVTR